MRIHSFDHVAYDYAAKVTPHRYAHYATMVHELQLSGDETILDVGCGPGILSLEVAERLTRGRLIGIDSSPNMIELARSSSRERNITNADFALGDALALEFPDNSFDLLMSSLVFPWVKDQNRFLREVHRVLKPGGRLVMITLSDIVYREFIQALKETSKKNPDILNIKGDAFRFLGARVFNLNNIVREVARANLNVYRRFRLTTEDPVTPREYLTRINGITDENYLEGLNEAQKEIIRSGLFRALGRRNGTLTFTESALFVLARKLGSTGHCTA